MVRFCAVVGCSNRSNRESDKKYYSFPGIRDNRGRDIPEGIQQRKLWIEALRRADLTDKKIRFSSVCSDHFITGKPASSSETSNPDYVPTQKMGYVSIKSSKSGATSRYERHGPPRVEPQAEAEVQVEEHNDEPVAGTSQFHSGHISCHTQTIVVDEDILLHQELYDLRKFKESSTFQQSSFVNDDQKTLYFTGIPTYNSLNSIFSRLIEEYIRITPQQAIKEKFTHFLITLMKLRLNIDFKLLAYLFRVSIQTISRLFYKTLDIMYYRLKNFVYWPTREQLVMSMPDCFKEAFGNKICLIIDCFEIRVERSRNLAAQSSTWSSYKHFNTVKVLIGITPQGSISFISQGYGGRISDKALTEECGILNKLLPGDVILADRGFLIEEMVGLHMATVITPAFLKGKKQLNPQEIESTRNIASVRIHVERVIGALRQKYTILYDIIPMFLARKKYNEMASLDQVLTVCSALVNLCPRIVE